MRWYSIIFAIFLGLTLFSIANSVENVKGGAAGGKGTYTVKSGDTLFGIALACGTTLDKLIAANPKIKDPNFIVPGEVITLPSGAMC